MEAVVRDSGCAADISVRSWLDLYEKDKADIIVGTTRREGRGVSDRGEMIRK